MAKFVTRTLGEICDEVGGVIRTGPLVFRNRNLRRTRDLLLPRLVSGEVEVGEGSREADAGAD